MYKRQLNSFLANLGIKQLFWSNVRRRCQRDDRQKYKEVVTFICTHKFDAICSAFLWDDRENPCKPGLSWNAVHRLWHQYCKKHNFN